MKNKLSFFLLIIITCIWIDACKVGPNFKTDHTQIDSLAEYRYDSLHLAMEDSALNLKWWGLFNDPVLDTLIITGLRENKDILIASSRIEQARAAIGIAKADYWPQIGYSAGAKRGNVFQGIPTGEGTASNMFTGFGTLNWELDFWGKFRRSTEAAKAELAASEFGKRTIQIGLISEITGTYFLLLNYQTKLEISKSTFRLRKEMLEIIQARFDEGIIPEIDLNQAQVQKAIAESAIPYYERKIAQTENALSVLLGRNPAPITTGTPLMEQQQPPDIPVGLPSMLLERRPDVLMAEQLLHAQTAKVGVAVAQRFPSISLTGLLGVASDDISKLTANGMAWSAGASLLGPLFYFGKNKRRVDVERYKTEQMLHEYERTVITAFKEVENALVEIETLKRERRSVQDQVNAALNARNLSKQRYDKGVTSFLEVLESQRQAFDSELKLSGIIQQLYSAYVKLYKSLGGGWITPEEMQNAASGK